MVDNIAYLNHNNGLLGIQQNSYFPVANNGGNNLMNQIEEIYLN